MGNTACCWIGNINIRRINQSNLQIKCNLYQITKAFFTEIRTKNFMIYMEIQKTLKS